MKDNMEKNTAQAKQEKLFVSASTILRYLIAQDQQLDDFIILGRHHKPLMTTDKELHEALGSLAKYDLFKPTKLAKFFEVVDVYPHRDLTKTPKPLLTFEKVEAIRKEALKAPKASKAPSGSEPARTDRQDDEQ